MTPAILKVLKKKREKVRQIANEKTDESDFDYEEVGSIMKNIREFTWLTSLRLDFGG